MPNNIYTTDENLRRIVSGWPSLQSIEAGCQLTAGIDGRGRLHDSSATGLRTAFQKRFVCLALDKSHPGVIFGLKADGTCVVGKDPFAGWPSHSERYSETAMGNDAFETLLRFVEFLRGIVQIAVTGSLFLALDERGIVHAALYRREESRYGTRQYAPARIAIRKTVCSWQGVRRILIAEEELVIAQKNTGELVCAGSTQDLYGTFGKAGFLRLQDHELADACSYYGGESRHFAFLDSENRLHTDSRRYEEADGVRFVQLAGLDHSFLGLREDGEIVGFQGLETKELSWPQMRQISLGRKDPYRYDDLFLAGLSRE